MLDQSRWRRFSSVTMASAHRFQAEDEIVRGELAEDIFTLRAVQDFDTLYIEQSFLSAQF
jgi:hypothetical protein